MCARRTRISDDFKSTVIFARFSELPNKNFFPQFCSRGMWNRPETISKRSTSWMFRIQNRVAFLVTSLLDTFFISSKSTPTLFISWRERWIKALAGTIDRRARITTVLGGALCSRSGSVCIHSGPWWVAKFLDYDCIPFYCAHIKLFRFLEFTPQHRMHFFHVVGSVLCLMPLTSSVINVVQQLISYHSIHPNPVYLSNEMQSQFARFEPMHGYFVHWNNNIY